MILSLLADVVVSRIEYMFADYTDNFVMYIAMLVMLGNVGER